jgi:hypothetical protein
MQYGGMAVWRIASKENRPCGRFKNFGMMERDTGLVVSSL